MEDDTLEYLINGHLAIGGTSGVLASGAAGAAGGAWGGPAGVVAGFIIGITSGIVMNQIYRNEVRQPTIDAFADLVRGDG